MEIKLIKKEGDKYYFETNGSPDPQVITMSMFYNFSNSPMNRKLKLIEEYEYKEKEKIYKKKNKKSITDLISPIFNHNKIVNNNNGISLSNVIGHDMHIQNSTNENKNNWYEKPISQIIIGVTIGILVTIIANTFLK
jgi:hypothetical protein